MNNTMPEEQIEFMKKISNYMEVSNNMSKEEANDFAFRVWQNERFFKELFGYNNAIDDAVKEIDSMYFDGGAREILACANATKNYIRNSIEKLKEGANYEVD